jgi:WD40 repeat protein
MNKGLTFNQPYTTRFVQMTLTHSKKYLGIFLFFWLFGCQEVQNNLISQQVITGEGTVAGAISPKAQLVAVSSLTSGIVVWDLQQQQAKFRLSHGEPVANLVTTVTFSDDGGFLLTGTANQVALWQMNDGKNIGFWSMPAGVTVRDIAVSNLGKHLLIAQSDGKVQHITLSTGRRIEFLGHTENVNSVALSPNGRYALTGGSDLQSYLWDTQSAQILLTMPSANRVTKVALDPQARYAFSADSQKQATIYDLTNGQRITQLPLDRGRIFTAARFSDDGKHLLTGAPSQRVSIWTVATGALFSDWLVTPSAYSKQPNALVYDVALMPNQQVLSISSSGVAEYWEFTHE